MAVDDPDRSHDTDPLADTQTSDGDDAAKSASSSASTSKRRSVDVGDSLGNRYELVENVGEGGMATVYRARDKELRREVAVKVLFPHLARREEVVRRFHREARAAAGLEHANILRVYDVGGGESASTRTGGGDGEAIDPPYIVMELIRGQSLLGEIERRGPMLAEVVACIGAVLADALAVAHKAGIIHRDIKPANVMIDGKGRVLLADFGVARLETEDSLVTKTGAVLGTPAYMSPEQAAGDTATAKSDLYSLGATLYQLATGHLPYSGSPAKVLAQIAQGSFVSAVKKRTEVGPDLSRMIDRLMAVEANARPPNATAVADELRKISSAGGFAEPKDELAAYFAEPDAFVKQKTPMVVAALLKSGETAIREGKLPRAIAIADRASALAPDDPAVTQLVATVTEGGRSSERRRVVALAGIGVVVAGLGTVAALTLFREGEPTQGAHGDATVAMGGDDALPNSSGVDALLAAGPFDAMPEIDGAVALLEQDAGTSRTRDAGIAMARPRDAAVAATVDAAPQVTLKPDAGPTAVPPDSAVIAPAKGYILVKTDAWCNVKIDDTDHGTVNPGKSPRIEVTAGPHTVVCVQTGRGTSWTKQVTVAAGKTTEASGSILGLIDVTFGVAAIVDGRSYAAGAATRLTAGSHDVRVGDKRAFVAISRDCQIRSAPEIACYSQ